MLLRMIRFVVTVTLLALAFMPDLPADAAVRSDTALPAVAAPHPLPLDPALSDPAWAAGAIPAGGGFENLTTRSPARLETHAFVLYDKTNLYVATRSDQSGVALTATQTTNNVGFGTDDFVGVGVDPSGNGAQVYYFETTPRGVRYQQSSENARYAPEWQAAAAVQGGGWNAVMIIPLRSLRFPSSSPQTWRFNVIRNVAATGEHYSYGYDGLMSDGPIPNAWPNFVDVRFWPKLANIALTPGAAVRPRPRVELFGLGAAGLDRDLVAQANGSFVQQPPRPFGLDASIPLDNTINLVATLNPDFSNVEIDQQTIAPQEFKRALVEYRPFFAQGAPFLNPNPMPFFAVTSPGNLIFYSPDVGPFDRGAKVEGAFGLQSFGALSFRGFDETTGNTFDDIAFGYKHLLPDRTFQYWADGVLARHSVAGTDDTVEAGFAGRNLHTGLVYGVDQAFEQGTAVADPGFARSLNGFVDVHKPNYEVYLGYNDISPNYNPLDGFTVNSDIAGPETYVNLLGSTKWLKNYAIYLGADRFLDQSGMVHESDTIVNATATFKNGLSLNNVGTSVGLLRGYDAATGPSCAPPADGARTYYTGYPCYLGGRNDRFNQFGGGIGYRDGTSTPLDVSYSAGPFGTSWVHQFTTTTSRPLFGRYALSLEYDGTYERALADGSLNSQWLRRVSVGASLGSEANVSLGLRAINGTGGFGTPGMNVAASYHVKFKSGNELFVNYGTPAATTTLDRVIVKYLMRFGGGAGT
jgi:hypothetical protein